MILHVISGLGVGGAEAMLVQVAGSLQARGIQQHVVSLVGRGENATRLEARGVTVSSLDVRSIYSAPSTLLRLCRIVGRERPTIIQGWMYHGNLMAALAHRLVPWRTRRQLYWGLRATNMDELRYGWINMLCARMSRLPNLIIANSYAGVLAHQQYGYRPRRFVVVANGVDVKRFHANDELRQKMRFELELPPDAFVAIHVARVDAMKDHRTFLAALAKAPAAIGLLVGAGTEALLLPPNVRALGLRRDIERLYLAADIVVSSSAFGEGFSNVIAEGMATGLIPVATDVGDARMIVGGTGRVIPPGDVDAMAAAINAEARAPSDERSRRSLAARARIQQNFTIEKSVDSFAQLYAESEKQVLP